MSKPDYPHVFCCTPLGDFYQRLELNNERLEKYNKLIENGFYLHQSARSNGWEVYCFNSEEDLEVCSISYDEDKETNMKIDECIDLAYSRLVG